MQITKLELKRVLAKHAEWLKDLSKGACADLRNADLRNADLRNADLRNADLRNANLRNADLRNADLRNANLRNANLRNADLRNADLRNANLRGANLRGADLDYSCLPLWCGSLDIKIDKRLAAQTLYHFLRMKTTNKEILAVQKLPKLRALASKFHRFGECEGLED